MFLQNKRQAFEMILNFIVSGTFLTHLIFVSNNFYKL